MNGEGVSVAGTSICTGSISVRTVATAGHVCLTWQHDICYFAPRPSSGGPTGWNPVASQLSGPAYLLGGEELAPGNPTEEILDDVGDLGGSIG